MQLDHLGEQAVINPSRSERGEGLVELALVLPVLILVLVVIFDLGRAVYSYNTISNAAREAMRSAIVDQDLAVIEGRAVQHAVALGLTDADVEVAFLTADLSADCPPPADVGCVAQVTVHYQFVAATPVIGSLLGIIDMNSTSRALIERSYDTP